MKKKTPMKKKVKKINKELLVIQVLFTGFFLTLIGYLTYLIYDQSEIIRSKSNNPLLDIKYQNVMRGSIYDRRGEVLARSYRDTEGADSQEIRDYPKGELFFHTIGYEKPEKQGVELLANHYLREGQRGVFEYLTRLKNKNISRGNSVYTTLDTNLQQIGWDALGDFDGGILLMETDTGKIISLVSKPASDPNNIHEAYNELLMNEGRPLLNRVTQGNYAPGSIFKLVPALALYRANRHETFTYDCKGVDYFDNTLVCYNSKAHGEETVEIAFAQSCNTFFAKVGVDLGVDTLKDSGKALLYDELDELEIGKLQSQISKRDLFNDDNIKLVAETSIGQGETSVTPLHMGLLAMAIGNGGLIYRPYMVDYVVNAKGNTVKKYMPEVYRHILKSDEVSYLKNLMGKVVEEGTGKGLQLSNKEIKVYAKTGTAEVDDDIAHSWVIGFAEGLDKNITFVVLVEKGGSSSKRAVPIAKKLLEEYYK